VLQANSGSRDVLLRPQSADRPDEAKRSVVSRLEAIGEIAKHPNIHHAIGVTEDCRLLFAGGCGTLRSDTVVRARSGRWWTARAVHKLLTALVHALATLHSAAVVHGDVCLGNVLLLCAEGKSHQSQPALYVLGNWSRAVFLDEHEPTKAFPWELRIAPGVAHDSFGLGLAMQAAGTMCLSRLTRPLDLRPPQISWASGCSSIRLCA